MISEIEIKDDSTVKASKWNERSLSLWIPNFVGDISIDKDKTIISIPDTRLCLYPLTDGFEYEICLVKKPLSNEITLSIDTAGLICTKQPPLTEEVEVGKEYFKVTDIAAFDKKGNELLTRPIEIVNSIVFKHDIQGYNKFKDAALFSKYGHAKLGTLLRPCAKNANGIEVWCDQRIEKGQLIITIPYDFWNNSLYPITIDPTFGLSGVGGSSISLENQVCAAIATCPAAGTGNKITANLDVSEPWDKAKAALYSGTGVIANGLCTERTLEDGDADYDFTFTATPTLANQAYYIAAYAQSESGTCKLTYDVGAGAGAHDGNTYNGFPDPATWTADASRDIYINVDYTAAGGAAYIPRVIMF